MSVILLTYANNEDAPLQHLREEDDGVDEMLSRSVGRNKRFFVERDQYITRQKIARKLLERRDEIEFFGYSGHAGRDVLVMEDDLAHAEGVAHLLSLCPLLKVVMLNGCSTQGQVKALLEKGIPVVIATHAPVGDITAKVFAIALFDALRKGDTLEQAFEYARGVVNTSRNDVNFYRGFNLPPYLADQAWGLFCREGREDARQWKLPTGEPPKMVLSGAGEAPDTIKAFFIADEESREKYYLRIHHSFRVEIQEGAALFNDLAGVSNPIEQELAIKEMEASDAVVLLVNGLNFFTFWNRFPWLKTYLEEGRKPIIFVKLPGDDESVANLKQELGATGAQMLPEHASMFNAIKDQPASLEGFLRFYFKKELQSALQQVMESRGAPKEKLRDELLEFDLTSPTQAFQAYLREDARFRLVAIQGTDRCGQDLLLSRIRGYLPFSVDNCPPIKIDFHANGAAISAEAHLWRELSRYLFAAPLDDAEIVCRILSEKLKQEDIVIVLENVAIDESEAEKLRLVASMWSKIIQTLPAAPGPEYRQLFVFAINRATHRGVHFESPDFQPPSVIVLNIERIDHHMLADWHFQKKPRFRDYPQFAHLLDNPQKILGEGYLSEVVFQICECLNCRTLYPQLIRL